MYAVTPRCAAAAVAVISALVLRRPTKEYTHPYSMMQCRLSTAGIEVAPHHHQLLVYKALRSAGGIRPPLRLLRKEKYCEAEKEKSVLDVLRKGKLAT